MVRKRDTGEIFALKSMMKSAMVMKNQVWLDGLGRSVDCGLTPIFIRWDTFVQKETFWLRRTMTTLGW